jgi:DNA-binding transcriptional regulator YdaS (Cro superfamily)
MSSKRYCPVMNQELGFKTFFSELTADEKRALARRANTSVAYLSQMANGFRSAGYSVSARLKAADPRITDKMLRPDIFGEAQASARVA